MRELANSAQGTFGRSKDERALLRRVLDGNSTTPSEVLADLAGDRSSLVRRAVAENRATPPDVLAILAGDRSASVRRAVAGNSATPPDVLAELAGDSSAPVRRAVAGNSATSPDVLANLTHGDEAKTPTLNEKLVYTNKTVHVVSKNKRGGDIYLLGSNLNKLNKSIRHVARSYGFSVEDLKETLEDLRARMQAAHGVMGRVKAKTRARQSDDLKLSPSQVAAVIADSTLGRLQARYDTLLKISFPSDRLEDVKQARLAAKLSTTYGRLRQRQVELGLDPLPKDRRVAEAERLRSAFYGRGQKKEPTRAQPRRSARAKVAPGP